MRHQFYLALLVVLLLLGGCGKFSEEWIKEGYTGNEFSKLVVVGISPEPDEQRFYETQAIHEFQELGVQVHPGATFFPKEINEGDTIDVLITKNGIDAILTLEVIVQEDDEYFLPEDYNRFSKFYARKSKPYTPAYYTTGHRFLMVATLFDLKGSTKEEKETIVWRASKIILNPQENEGKKSQVIKNAVEELVNKELIKVK